MRKAFHERVGVLFQERFEASGVHRLDVIVIGDGIRHVLLPAAGTAIVPVPI